MYAFADDIPLFRNTSDSPVFEVPFVDQFDSNTNRKHFTTIDANNDGNTIVRHYQESLLPGWLPDRDYEEMQYYSNASTQTADDWFITPKIHLQPGKVYAFSFNARVSFDGYTQKVEARMGRENTVEGMTTELIKVTTLASSDYKTLEGEFTVEEEGNYNFGIHIVSDPGEEYLYFDDVTVKVASAIDAPAAVESLSVTPDPEGLLRTIINCTAPSTTINGNELTSITKVEITRDDNTIATLTGIVPGQTINYTDNGPKTGYNQYTVTVYNSDGKGLRAIADPVYVGVDTPLPPEPVTFIDNGESIDIHWAEVPGKGTHGMVVRPDGITYTVIALNDSYEWQDEIAETKKLSYTYTYNTNKGGQDLKRFGIMAGNEAGYSDYACGRLVVGAPYNLPFHESFATGVSHALTWMEGDGNFSITTGDSSDSDAGSIGCMARYDGEQTSLNLGKINFRQALHPVLTFKYMMSGEEDNLTVKIAQKDGTHTEVKNVTGATEDWTEVTVDLADFCGAGYIIPKFQFTGTHGEYIFIDDINIADLYDYDLAIDITSQQEAMAGSEAAVSATVSNVGLTPVRGYTVILYVDDKEAATADGALLTCGESKQHEFSIAVNGKDGEFVDIVAVLICDYDLNTSNNRASAPVMITADPAGITAMPSAASPQDVYTLDGRLVKKGATSLSGLSNGVYVINGRKIIIKRK